MRNAPPIVPGTPDRNSSPAIPASHAARATLMSTASADCLAQESHGVDALKNPEPDFYILGSKSYGRNTTFLMRVGWEQVNEVFSLLVNSPTGTVPAAVGDQ